MTWDLEWEVARAIYEGRLREAWGNQWETRDCFPKTDKERRSYFHNPVAEIDLALASARAVIDRFQMTARPDKIMPKYA